MFLGCIVSSNPACGLHQSAEQFLSSYPVCKKMWWWWWWGGGLNAHPRLILSTAGWMWSGTAVRYLKVQCTSVGMWQAHDVGQPPLVCSRAAENNRAFSSHGCRYEALQEHTPIVHVDGLQLQRRGKLHCVLKHEWKPPTGRGRENTPVNQSKHLIWFIVLYICNVDSYRWILMYCLNLHKHILGGI